MLDGAIAVALIIFALIYLVLVIGEFPGFCVYRTSAAMIGAVSMVVCGALPAGELLAAIDFRTMVLLFSMMIVAASLRLCGAFRWLADAVLRRAGHHRCGRRGGVHIGATAYMRVGVPLTIITVAVGLLAFAAR